MTFAEASDYLLSLGNEVSAMKLGLENISVLLATLGSPHNDFYKVQVAGTNGKGSVCAFVGEICSAAGIKTGIYTSPHLSSITERIRINGRDISPNDFAQIASQVRAAAEALLSHEKLRYLPTFFEQVTAIALVAFSNAGIEVAILETGLGGRLDATTAAAAEVAVITRVDLDHQEYLGSTIEEIAAEKAAIIQVSSKAVLGEQRQEAMRVLAAECERKAVSPILAGKVRATSQGGKVEFRTDKGLYSQVELPLLGKHQVENAKTAICTAEILQDRFDIPASQIVAGLNNARHPGRLEWIGRFLLDGAHNPGGARSLRDFLAANNLFDVTLLFGAMRDKDASSMLDLLLPHAANLILAKPGNDRAAEPDEVGGDRHLGAVSVYRSSSILEAIKMAEDVAGADGVVVIAGSLYLVGEARTIVQDRMTDKKTEYD